MKSLAVVVVFAIAVVSGCSAGEQEVVEPVAASTADRCDEVDRQYLLWEKEIEGWAADRDVARGNLERAQEEEYLDSEDWAPPPTLEFRNQINNLEALMSDQLLRMAYLAADNPQCFTPGLVADAKVLIERFE